jgi:serine/threonine protein kinase
MAKPGGDSYIALEAVEGKDLLTSIAKSRIGLGDAMAIGARIAAALAKMHRAGWIWRDCKPSNVLVSGSKIRLIDMEGACRAGQEQVIPWTTPGYWPPELRARPTARIRKRRSFTRWASCFTNCPQAP